jgi:hypothetical protein
VFDIVNQNILVERKLRSGETALPAKSRERITKKSVSRKNVSDLKGGSAAAKERSDKARGEARAAARQTPEPTERQKTLARLQDAQRKRNMEKAKSNQTPTKSKSTKTKSGIASRIGSALKYVGDRAREDSKKVARAAGTTAGVVHGAGIVAHRLGKEAGKSKTGQAIKKKLGISEEAESEQQQKLFGLALSVKRGQTPRSEVSAEVLKIVETMSEKQIRKYAKTKHSDVPKKVDEAVSQISGRENNPPVGTTAKQDNIQRQQLTNQKRMLDKKRKYEMDILNQQKLGKLPMGRGSMGEENEKPSALDIVRQKIIDKYGAASLVGTPENKAARKAAAAKAKANTQPKASSKERYKDDVYSKDGLGGIRGYRSGD